MSLRGSWQSEHLLVQPWAGQSTGVGQEPDPSWLQGTFFFLLRCVEEGGQTGCESAGCEPRERCLLARLRLGRRQAGSQPNQHHPKRGRHQQPGSVQFARLGLPRQPIIGRLTHLSDLGESDDHCRPTTQATSRTPPY